MFRVATINVFSDIILAAGREEEHKIAEEIVEEPEFADNIVGYDSVGNELLGSTDTTTGCGLLGFIRRFCWEGWRFCPWSGRTSVIIK